MVGVMLRNCLRCWVSNHSSLRYDFIFYSIGFAVAANLALAGVKKIPATLACYKARLLAVNTKRLILEGKGY